MQLFPRDPEKKKTLLIIIGVGVVLVGLGFFFVRYGAFGTPAEVRESAGGAEGGSSEEALKIIEGNVSALREELRNDFYKSLKRYKWTADAAAPGKNNPFE